MSLKSLYKKNEWPNNSISPVLLFIDDLSNLWIDINEDGEIQPEEDWGFAGFSTKGVFKFLEKEILSDYPEVKVTFFVPAGPREPIIKNSKIKRIALPINYNTKSKYFFKQINDNQKYEIAYHGTTHGVAGFNSSNFKQEWETFKSLNHAKETIKLGKEIFKQTIGEYPKGGKYCGYKSNKYSDDSIDQSSFLWWCRYCQNDAVERKILDPFKTGIDSNPFSAYMPKIFGNNKVIDIPCTLNSVGYLNFYSKIRNKLIVDFIKKFINIFLKMRLKRKLLFLLKHNLVISIQEHISPSREDLKRQTPNIFDDKYLLKETFAFLKNFNVWFCTGTELANWIKDKKFK